LNKIGLHLFLGEPLQSTSTSEPPPGTSWKKRHHDELYSDSSDEESDTERALVISRTPAVQNLLVKKSGTKSEYYTILILFKCSTWQITHYAMLTTVPFKAPS
jgi:hypothetical protein